MSELRTNELLTELLNNQLKTVPLDKKLQYSDLKRISKYVDHSIFDYDKCALWTGYVTNVNNTQKGIYINFYFRNKKVALHRLLYDNFIGRIEDDEYLKFTCENKGRCCNLAHLRRHKFHRNEETIAKQAPKPELEPLPDDLIDAGNAEDLTIKFD